MDFEDELYSFFVRKEHNLNSADESHHKAKTHQNTKYKQSNILKEKSKVYNYIPLMVKHIHTLNENSWEENTINIFNGMIHFKHCLVYGKIMGKGNETKNTYSYLLDDGTGWVNIKIFRRLKEIETVWKLENELEGVKRDMLAQNKNEMVKSLRNLLLQTKKHLDASNLPVGCKVLIYGKPSYYRGQISLDAFHITQDVEPNCDIEITFKDQLIDWLTKNL